MVKKLLLGMFLALFLVVLPFQVNAARTDEGMWTQISTYIKTVCTGGCDVLINGVNRYLNFGSVSGTSGYGIRDNVGVIECKDSGGTWSACQDGAGGGLSGGIPGTIASWVTSSSITGTSTVNANAFNATSTTATSTFNGGFSARDVRISGLGAGIVKLNGSGYAGTASAGTDYQAPLTAGVDYEVPVTAGDGLTRTVNDFDCDTASGSIFGCLLSADWTRFDGKIGTSSVWAVLAGTTTTAIAEGTNLYWTSARGTSTVAQILAGTTTTAIDEGTNLYYLTSRARGDVAGLFPATTTSNTWAGTQTFTNATTTNASTTNLSVGGGFSFGGVLGSTWASFCTSITGSADLCDGNDGGGGGGSPYPFFASTVDSEIVAGTSTSIAAPTFQATSTTASSSFMLATTTQLSTNKLLFMDKNNVPSISAYYDTGDDFYLSDQSGNLAMNVIPSTNYFSIFNGTNQWELTTLGTTITGPFSTGEATTSGLAITDLSSTLLKVNGTGGVVGATAGVDYQAPLTLPLPVANGGTGVDGSAWGTNYVLYYDGSQYVLGNDSFQFDAGIGAGALVARDVRLPDYVSCDTDTSKLGTDLEGDVFCDTLPSYITLNSLSATGPVTYNNGTGVIALNTGYFVSSSTSNTWASTQGFSAITFGGATGTSLALTNLSAGLLKSNAGGAIGNASAGSDYEVPVTAGDGLTRTLNDFDCDTASPSVFGCLASVDWSLFHSKLSTSSWYSLFAGTSTTGLAEGANLYYTVARARADIAGMYPATTSAHTWSSLQTLLGGASTTNITADNSTSTFRGITLNGKNCTGLLNGGKLTTDASGGILCGDDTSGGAGGGTTTNTFTYVSSGLSRQSTTTEQILMGGTATTSRANLEILKRSDYPLTFYTDGYVGIGTTSPFADLHIGSTSPRFAMTDSGATVNSGRRSGQLWWLNGEWKIGSTTDTGSASTSFATFTVSTSTFSGAGVFGGSGTSSFSTGGINLTGGGCFASGGNCLGTMALSGSVGQVQYYSGVNTAVGTSSLTISLAGTTTMGFGASTTRIDATNGTSTFWGMVLNGKDCSSGTLKTNSSGEVICGTGGSAPSGTLGQVGYFSGTDTLVGTSSLSVDLKGYVGVGTTTPEKIFTVTGDQTGGIARIHRTNSATNGALGTYDILGESTGDMVDGFGVAQTFSVKDNASAINTMANIAGYWDGADTSGGIRLSSYLLGATSFARSLVLNALGNVGIGTSTPIHKLDVKGRINGQPMIQCPRPYFSAANATADRILTTTTGGVCGDQMQLDVQTTGGGILAEADNSASGTPSMMRMDASIAAPAANNNVAIKSYLIGSATSSMGRGIAMEQIVRLPQTAVASSGPNFSWGFSTVAAGSVATNLAYANPTDGCLLQASTTANVWLYCFKAGVPTRADTGIATSTMVSQGVRFLLVLDGSGANVYVNGGTTARATIASASLPVRTLRYASSVGINAAQTPIGVTIGQARMDIYGVKIWAGDMDY